MPRLTATKTSQSQRSRLTKSASVVERSVADRTGAATDQAVDADGIAGAVDAAATRHRLLDAAGAVFAEHGFERAHVRDICARARANVAAVKYHFGGKFQLYEAAIGYWFERQERQYPMSPAGESDPRERLRQFTRLFVGRMLDHAKPAWHARLLAREMVEPTSVLDRMIGASIRPTLAHLRGIVRAIVGDRCPDVVVERAMLSVIAQCVFYVHARPVLERVFPKHVDSPDIDAIADHIAAFSYAGLRDLNRRQGARS